MFVQFWFSRLEYGREIYHEYLCADISVFKLISVFWSNREI